MKNPWRELPTKAPYVLERDRDIIDAFNEWYETKDDCRVQTHLYPEPFIGDRASPVYLLGLNPGYAPYEDDEWHKKDDFSSAILSNLAHEVLDTPFYFLDSRFSDAPGAKWWLGKCKWLVESIGLEKLARRIFCVELFPYHSTKYQAIPQKISSSQSIPSSDYSVYLVEQAIQEEKVIVAMRSFRQWCERVPELEGYGKLIRLNSPQNVALSPKNVQDYDALLDALQG